MTKRAPYHMKHEKPDQWFGLAYVWQRGLPDFPEPIIRTPVTIDGQIPYVRVEPSDDDYGMAI